MTCSGDSIRIEYQNKNIVPVGSQVLKGIYYTIVGSQIFFVTHTISVRNVRLKIKLVHVHVQRVKKKFVHVQVHFVLN